MASLAVHVNNNFRSHAYYEYKWPNVLMLKKGCSMHGGTSNIMTKSDSLPLGSSYECVQMYV